MRRIVSFLERLSVSVAYQLGYSLQPLYRPRLRETIPIGSKLYVGCGEQHLDGYICCDLRPLPHVTLACKAWEVSQFTTNLSEIYSRHMLEHLTVSEARLTIEDWFRALAAGGMIRIEVPNIRFAIQQWLRAEWSEQAFNDRYSDASWGTAGLFGWQRESNPKLDDYNNTYWDVHKSGYDEQLLRFLLNRAGFVQIQTQLERFSPAQIRRRMLSENASDGCHLVATAFKPELALRSAA